MPNLPDATSQFDKRRETFERWLSDHGSEIRTPTNPYEVIRFTTPEGVGVVYRNDKGHITSWTGGAAAAWSAYMDTSISWRVGKKRFRKSGMAWGQKGETIIKRDGPGCWYCGEEMTEDGPRERTIEHMCPVTHRGPDHLSNLVLACNACNVAAGSVSVAEKVRLREEIRARPKQPQSTGAAA